MTSPFDLHGPAFLALYGALVALTLGASVLLRKLARPPAGEPRPDALDLDAYEVAYLAGGEAAAGDAAIASLVQDGALEAAASTRTLLARGTVPPDAHPLERAVLRAASREAAVHVSTPRAAGRAVARELARGLEEKGLLVRGEEAFTARFLPVLLCAGAAAFGAVKVGVGLSRDRPVLFLFLLCAVPAVAAALFLKPVAVLRSRRGDRALEHLTFRNAALEHAFRMGGREGLSGHDAALALALFGTGAFAVGPLANLRRAMAPPPRDPGAGGWGGCGSSCSSGSSCGGGGGCGGCGGCGS